MLGCGLSVVAPPLARAQTPARAFVALTIDDLPDHGPIPAGSSRTEIATRIITALQEAKSPPVYGFINAKQLQQKPEDAEVLKLWRAAGFPLGNHAFSHMDLHTNPADAFIQDVTANEPALRTLMGDADWHWFRYPYLREGDTPDKYKAVRTFLGRAALPCRTGHAQLRRLRLQRALRTVSGEERHERNRVAREELSGESGREPHERASRGARRSSVATSSTSCCCTSAASRR